MLNNMTSLWKKSAAEIIKLIGKKEVSSEEVLSSSLSRISEVNSKINAGLLFIRPKEATT